MSKIDTKRLALEATAYAPYDGISNPTVEDWKKAYDALKELTELYPKDGRYPNTLGYLCFYGRHTGGQRAYVEARSWFEKGAALQMIESTYKLADMLMNGLGGPKDPDQALNYYVFLYQYCRNEFESGEEESKFPDIALRLGRLFHEGNFIRKDDMEALGYLLEAKYAINWRMRFGHYGDTTVLNNIQSLIDSCEQPTEEMLNSRFLGIGMARVPHYLMMSGRHQMTIKIDVDETTLVRLEFRRKKPDGSKPTRILWNVAPALKCFFTDCVVLVGAEVRLIWNKNPGEIVICDEYKYDDARNEHQFYLNSELQCRLMGGDYFLSMDEFMLAEMDRTAPFGTMVH